MHNLLLDQLINNLDFQKPSSVLRWGLTVYQRLKIRTTLKKQPYHVPLRFQNFTVIEFISGHIQRITYNALVSR